MFHIACKGHSINIILHYPNTDEGQHELMNRIGNIHADLVSQHIKKLNCPSDQKLQLLDELIKSVASKNLI